MKRTDRTAQGSRRLGLPAVAAWSIVAAFALLACGGSTNLTSAGTTSATTGQSSAASATSLLTSGIAQANAKQYKQAETTFHAVLILSPDNKFAWYNLGLLAQIQNQAATALADYGKAISIDPKYTPAMYNKAILLERTDLRSALALYRQIIAINPKAATAYLRESFVYDRLGDKRSASQARARAIGLDSSLSTVTTG